MLDAEICLIFQYCTPCGRTTKQEVQRQRNIPCSTRRPQCLLLRVPEWTCHRFRVFTQDHCSHAFCIPTVALHTGVDVSYFWHRASCWAKFLTIIGVPNCCTVVSVCFPFATSLHGSFFGLPPVCKPSCKCLYHGSMKIREKSKDVNDMVNSYQICSICTENVCHHLPILNFKINNSKSRQGI